MFKWNEFIFLKQLFFFPTRSTSWWLIGVSCSETLKRSGCFGTGCRGNWTVLRPLRCRRRLFSPASRTSRLSSLPRRWSRQVWLHWPQPDPCRPVAWPLSKTIQTSPRSSNWLKSSGKYTLKSPVSTVRKRDVCTVLQGPGCLLQCLFLMYFCFWVQMQNAVVYVDNNRLLMVVENWIHLHLSRSWWRAYNVLPWNRRKLNAYF